MSQVKLIWITENAEDIIAYCARVSNPQNQDNPNISRLLKYCAEHKHWSIFEMANMCLEIETTRAVSAQILRHRSFSFQEFSQRYAPVQDIYFPDIRRQDETNRQNSIDDLDTNTKEWWEKEVGQLYTNAQEIYQQALEKGIAKECARFILPMSSKTRLYMNGTIRSWIHYLQLRGDKTSGTQLEHYEIAKTAQKIFVEQLPIIAEALQWK